MPFTSAPLFLEVTATAWAATPAALASVVCSAAAYAAGSLTLSGAVAAAFVGVASLVAGWDWGVLLLLFFVTGTGWSHVGRAGKDARTAGVIAKGGRRDAAQVLANGGVFAAAAIGFCVSERTAPPWGGAALAWRALGLGALASAAADTWATEIGTLWEGTPRSLVTGKAVAPGTSGGVTSVGTLAGVAGAVCLGIGAIALGWGRAASAAGFLGGVGGMLVDSLLGATAQSRRWCERCNTLTERSTHICGMATRRTGGVSWLENDGVNAMSTALGAMVGWAVARVMGS